MTADPQPAPRVDFVKPALLHDLRMQVLRPGRPLSSVDHEYDYFPGTFHVATFDAANEVMACATFYPEPTADGRDGWRLRAMASAPHVRGQGYGSRALRFGIAEVKKRGGVLLWCNARSGAVWFYERLGFATVGEEFDIPPIGPHYVMEIEL